MKKVVINRKGKGWFEATFSAEVMLAVDYRVRATFSPPHSLSWTLLSSSQFKKNDGGWELKKKGANKTLAHYFTNVELSVWLPQTVVAGFIKSGLSDMLGRFKERAEKKYG